MTFEQLKADIDSLSPEQLKQTVAGYFGDDWLQHLQLVANPRGELVFIPEFNEENADDDN